VSPSLSSLPKHQKSDFTISMIAGSSKTNITRQGWLSLLFPSHSSSFQPKYHQNAFDDCGVLQKFQAYQDMGLLPPLFSSNSESMRQPHDDCALQKSNSSANYEKRQTKSVMFFRKSAVDSHICGPRKARQKTMT
jgi:hypothetical protein